MMQLRRASTSLFFGSLSESDHFCRKLIFRYPVEVLAFILIFINTTSHASTGTSWTKTPSWASDDSESPSSASRKSVRSRDLNSDSISPFSPGSNNLALDLGQVFLMGDLSSQFENSLGSQIHYTYGVSDLFGFDSSLGYSEHSNGQFSMTTLLTGMRMNLSWYDKIVPYFIFGLGFYRPHYASSTQGAGTETPSITPSTSAVLFGIHLGPGIDLQLTKNMFFGAAVTYHNMFGTTQMTANGSPFNIGGSYTSFYLHLGATF